MLKFFIISLPLKIKAQNEKILEFLNVTHVINITKHIENKYECKGNFSFYLKRNKKYKKTKI